jgi:hypothetical protein
VGARQHERSCLLVGRIDGAAVGSIQTLANLRAQSALRGPMERQGETQALNGLRGDREAEAVAVRAPRTRL